MAKAKPKECPCHSGVRYADCCGRFHAGKAPDTPEQLMRSRFSAFALGLGEYLVDTVSANHEDRAVPRADLVRALSMAKTQQRFLGLRIAHHAEEENTGEVLFVARVYVRGEDQSFAELSEFVREEGRWRYARGTLLPTARLPRDPSSLTLEEFFVLSAG